MAFMILLQKEIFAIASEVEWWKSLSKGQLKPVTGIAARKEVNLGHFQDSVPSCVSTGRDNVKQAFPQVNRP